MKTKTIWAVCIIISAVCTTAILLVSWHSLGEIHYLKTFLPGSLTPEEAYYAAWIEMIKVHIISLPLVLVISLCLFFIWLYKKKDLAE